MYYICTMNNVQSSQTPLAEAMKRERWNDRLLGLEVGLSPMTVRLYRTGARLPRVDDAMKISALLKRPIEELFPPTEATEEANNA